ncbi:MAG: hypothetical protein COA95_00035 [Methylophaga sp.]|nr:MAG: hypothetical protein COA95_00035 [Methylophaga sp.]
MGTQDDIRTLLSKESLHYVSHYTSLENLKLICQNQTLRMGQMKNVNDFDELQHQGINIDLQGIDRSDGSKMSNLIDKISSLVSEIYDSYIGVACFSKNNYQDGYITPSDTSFGNNVLWGTYASNLGGAALVFDPDLLKNQIDSYFKNIGSSYTIWSRTIGYTNGSSSRVHIHSFTVAAKDFEEASEEECKALAQRAVASQVESLLFNKREMWAPENEWRIVVISSKKGPHYIPYGNSLKAAIIGPRTVVDPRVIAKTVDFPVLTIGKAGNRPELDLLDPFNMI